jgi:threonine/homoserine/homoserine lactone efflux protein
MRKPQTVHGPLRNGSRLAKFGLLDIATANLRKNQRLVVWLNKLAGAVFVGLGIRLAHEKL